MVVETLAAIERTSIVDKDDGFESIPVKRKPSKSQRLSIENLPSSLDDNVLKAELKRVLQDCLGDNDTVEVVIQQERSKKVALVSIIMTAADASCSNSSIDYVLQKLRGLELNGKKLSVQRERRQRNNSNTKKSFGSWSKPRPTNKPQQDQQSAASEYTRGAVDATRTATAEASVPNGDSAKVRSKDGNDDDENIDFHALCQKPLANLMDDYGEQDLNWNKAQQPTTSAVLQQEESRSSSVQQHKNRPAEEESRLERHGKAPIHVEFLSFGYRHGVPSELARSSSSGSNHAFPLPAFDCRSIIVPVPQYLSWMDGTSGAVRNTLLRFRKDNENESSSSSLVNVRDYARSVVATDVANAVVAAMTEGDHGYALPLRMTIGIGSESGRHRSVVCAELAATALRKLLRQNANQRFQAAPVSVGTRHRDIDITAASSSKQGNNNKKSAALGKGKKQKDLEDDW